LAEELEVVRSAKVENERPFFVSTFLKNGDGKWFFHVEKKWNFFAPLDRVRFSIFSVHG
jgi:hypothetical protein